MGSNLYPDPIQDHKHHTFLFLEQAPQLPMVSDMCCISKPMIGSKNFVVVGCAGACRLRLICFFVHICGVQYSVFGVSDSLPLYFSIHSPVFAPLININAGYITTFTLSIDFTLYIVVERGSGKGLCLGKFIVLCCIHD